jgi:hypothetical protein
MNEIISRKLKNFTTWISRKDDSYEWSTWPWTRCHSVADEGRPGEYPRCDLKRKHRGPHRAERGMYDLIWDSNTILEERRYND